MAKPFLDAKRPYILVERGDTLSEIAYAYKNSLPGSPSSTTKATNQLAAINNIKDPNKIYVDQKVYLEEEEEVEKEPAPPTQVTIDHFGYQSNSSGVLFATWTWERSDTQHYEVEWTYDTGDSVWFIGNKSTTEDKQSTYSIPSNAKKVRFRVKPISKTENKNNKETSLWTANWSTVKTYSTEDNPPSVPGVPTVVIDKYKLTASLDNLDVNATQIQFKIVKNNSTTFKTGTATITTNHASYSCTVDADGEYKVACRSYNGTDYSDWSDYSSNVTTIPATPSGITTCKASSETAVYLEWEAVTGADTYTIEYTTKKQYFDGSDQVTPISSIESTHYEKTGLESGQEYFFRVRAINEKGESSWSDIVSVIIGKKPVAPTTWSSTTTAVTGEDVTLYWVHNAEDGSSQTWAELELIVGNETRLFTIKNSTDEDEKDKTSFYVLDTSSYIEGTTIKWRVRTKGIIDSYGDWSAQRTIDIYAPATLVLNMVDVDGGEIDVVESFPFYIHGLAGPNTQLPISYHLTVVSNETYETSDRIGNKTTINAGQEVYSKHFDITDSLMVELSAGNIDLENNVNYTVNCTVSMNSGLTTEASLPFTVSWTDVAYTPNAEISLDEENYVTHISPFCRSYWITNYKVEKNGTKYIKTTEAIGRVYGTPVRNRFTTTGEQVYEGTTAKGDDVAYCQVEESEVITGVSLSVYRREFDGRFTELAAGLVSGRDTFITDPHPALDYARYRIVAITDATGAVSYYDLPGYPVGGNAAIIQWDEAWTNFDVTSEDVLEEPAWAGSMLKLPYNIDVSDTSDPDVELVEYIGREHPVGYYGTQRGLTAVWNVEIEADDEETLYAIRRLQNWMGNAYVREPSGSGYWASVKVSFSQKHQSLTIPVTFTITRVEGGV